jgi:hypothetical protein
MPAFRAITDAITKEDEAKRKPLDSFRIIVDGQDVAVHKNREFLAGNADITQKLKEAGLTENIIFDPNFICTSYLVHSTDGNAIKFDDPEVEKCKLTKKQFFKLEELSKQMPWQIKETAYWEQEFLAGKEIEVIHEYEPFIGRNQTGSQQKLSEIIDMYSGKDACASETFKSLKSYSDLKKLYSGTLTQVEYILGTGRNWNGPIKNFKLILKKNSPEEIVSLCFPGKSIKTSPTTIEFSRINFEPQDKLIVFFYNLHRRDEN